MDDDFDLVLLSLEGLALGDAFGEQFFKARNRPLIQRRELPRGVWKWTDDTHMALSVVELLREKGRIDADELAKKFAYRFSKEPHRGYGRGAARLLRAIADGASWKEVAPQIFPGGSFGNGAAMRVAPLGAYFKDDFARLVQEARKSAMVTHYHPEGQAGAVTVALAAGCAAQGLLGNTAQFFDSVLQFLPDSTVKDGVRKAAKLPADQIERAARELGTGINVSAQDTVPFALWCATHFAQSYEEALWAVVRQKGDLDTLGAIVGGIVALNVGTLPKEWMVHLEPLEG